MVKRQGTLVSKIGRQKRAKGAMPSYLLHTSFYVRLYLGTETSFLSRSVSTDGKDGHGLKIEKIGPNVSSLNASPPKKYIWFVLPDKMCLLIFSSYPTCISTGTVFDRVKAVSNDFSEE